MLRFIVVGAAVTLLATPAMSQDAAEILRKVDEALRSLTTFEVVEVEHRSIKTPASKTEDEIRSTRAGAPGNRSRLEILGILTISDGNETWHYSRVFNEYTRRPSSRHPFLPKTAERFVTRRNARSMREEPVELETGQVMCWVVEADSDLTGFTYWIDKKRFLVLKTREHSVSEQRGTESIATTSMVRGSFGQPLPESLFRFAPPEGAVEVEELSSQERSPLLGSMLPEFELIGPAGVVLTPATLRGKYAVLYFAWYKTDQLMAFVELLHRAYKGQEVVVATILTSPPGSAAELSNLGYTMPAALDTDGAVSRKLGLPSPTVVIADPEGKVVFVQRSSGYGTARLIVSALRKAGLW